MLTCCFTGTRGSYFGARVLPHVSMQHTCEMSVMQLLLDNCDTTLSFNKNLVRGFWWQNHVRSLLHTVLSFRDHGASVVSSGCWVRRMTASQGVKQLSFPQECAYFTNCGALVFVG